MNVKGVIIILCAAGGVAGLFVLIALLTGKAGGKGRDRWENKGRSPRAAKPGRKKRLSQADTGESLTTRLVRPLASFWHLGDSSQSRLQELLVHAGIREKSAVDIFLGAKMALALALPAGLAAFLMWRGAATNHPATVKSLVIGGAITLVMGMMAPNIWLRRKANSRVDRIRLSLPDALDLLIVCVESGLALDAALVRISRELADVAPEFCEELQLMNLEISAGKPRDECLRNLALRSGCDEVESLAARINQSARYGTNLGNSLRIHSDSLRQKRRQSAEERAAKTTVKLLFPLVFFIFPAIFVVILGPAVAKVVRDFM